MLFARAGQHLLTKSQLNHTLWRPLVKLSGLASNHGEIVCRNVHVTISGRWGLTSHFPTFSNVELALFHFQMICKAFAPSARPPSASSGLVSDPSRHSALIPNRASSKSAMASTQTDPQVPGSLPGRFDMYDGIILDADGLPSTTEDFVTALSSSLPAWQGAGLRGIWLKIPISKAHFVGHAIDAGFVFHHAEPGYCMLTQWLPSTENKLPPNASHQVGVGAFVFDRTTRRVLVVQEKTGPLKGKGVWKMPTGLVQAGEDITEAAVREVEEETGVKAR